MRINLDKYAVPEPTQLPQEMAELVEKIGNGNNQYTSQYASSGLRPRQEVDDKAKEILARPYSKRRSSLEDLPEGFRGQVASQMTRISGTDWTGGRDANFNNPAELEYRRSRFGKKSEETEKIGNGNNQWQSNYGPPKSKPGSENSVVVSSLHDAAEDFRGYLGGATGKHGGTTSNANDSWVQLDMDTRGNAERATGEFKKLLSGRGFYGDGGDRGNEYMQHPDGRRAHIENYNSGSTWTVAVTITPKPAKLPEKKAMSFIKSALTAISKIGNGNNQYTQDNATQGSRENTNAFSDVKDGPTKAALNGAYNILNKAGDGELVHTDRSGNGTITMMGSELDRTSADAASAGIGKHLRNAGFKETSPGKFEGKGYQATLETGKRGQIELTLVPKDSASKSFLSLASKVLSK